jgi:PhnB protein
MQNKVKAIPEGYHSVTPYLIVKNASKAIEFYKKAFQAVEIMRFDGPDKKIKHAELKIGDSKIMLADEFPEMNANSPETIGGSPITLMLYVNDVDQTFNQATAAGAKVTRPLQDMFYGDRIGSLEDPFGHAWHLATHIEDVSDDEIQKRAQKFHEAHA